MSSCNAVRVTSRHGAPAAPPEVVMFPAAEVVPNSCEAQSQPDGMDTEAEQTLEDDDTFANDVDPLVDNLHRIFKASLVACRVGKINLHVTGEPIPGL